jgi:hypothetical protein
MSIKKVCDVCDPDTSLQTLLFPPTRGFEGRDRLLMMGGGLVGNGRGGEKGWLGMGKGAGSLVMGEGESW